MREPFTPELVHGILTTVMRGGRSPPGPKSEPVGFLTHVLNTAQLTAIYCRNHLPAEVKRGHAIAWALRILTEEAPKLRGGYVEALKIAESPVPAEIAKAQAIYGVLGAAETARANLETLDTLLAAAQAARRLSFYPAIRGFGVGGPSGRWQECAMPLMEAFREATGGSIEAGYRFVVAAVPRLTGETPTLGAVKIAVKRKRVQKEMLAVPGTNKTT
jgi:hypothetical protein